MSGGSFNYLCFKDAEDIFGYSGREELRRMVEELQAMPGAEDVAADAATALAIVDYQTLRLQAHLDHLHEVFKAVEWWRSCDYGEDDVKEAIAAYRGEKEATDG